MFKPLLSLLAVTLYASTALAQVELNPEHPDRYEVVRGDTLWDISERFLRNPWMWPEIWQANPQIENPHLIYPGDIISLSFVDGQPRLTLERGERPTLRMSPGVRRTPLREAIQPIDLQDILPFLEKRTILAADELIGIPYVVDIEEGYLAATEGQLIYVRDLNAEVGDVYSVIRPTVVFSEVPATFPFDMAESFEPVAEPWEYPGRRSISDHVDAFWQNFVKRQYTKHIRTLGYEARLAGVAEVVATGDPATLRLTSSEIEIVAGAMVVPVFTSDFDLEYFPRAATSIGDDGRVIGISKTLFGAGRNQVVAINKGWGDGIENGHVMRINRPSRTLRDEVKYPKDDVGTYFSRSNRKVAQVTIPEEYTGHLMVFKTFEQVSYALIVRSAQTIKMGDVLREP
ncbi:MAG: LysM domain-containing protein [Pseudomonadota bacterium]